MPKRHIISLAIVAGALVATAPAALAAPSPVPSTRACSVVLKVNYACLEVSAPSVPSGDQVIFTGTVSAKARKALAAWTKGDNIVCLTRYKTMPEADGWPSTTLEGACTTVRKDGGFTIDAELGRKGTFYYGVEMGPCRGSDALCGNGDPGLVGIGSNRGDKAVSLKTS